LWKDKGCTGMASEKLTALKVERARTPGLLNDGKGLNLRIAAGKGGLTKSWVFRFMIAGRAREMGLGSLDVVSLGEARERARKWRRLVKDGVDPIEARNARRAAARLETAKALSFAECAERYIIAHRDGWKSAKHAGQWSTTLEAYVFPTIGNLPVASIDTALVTKALEPIWIAKPQTASRVRGRTESILDWATARGYRQGENPARWRGHLENLLPKTSKLSRVEHHAALRYVEIGAFMGELRCQDGVSARALEFAILTAARTGEVLGALWDEIDLAEKLWTIPPSRMKEGGEHRVPLPQRALDVLEEMRIVRQGDLVFPGRRRGRPPSHEAMLRVLARMKRADLTAHGFRSTFRDWAAECTNFPREVCEMALAHAVGNRAEAAYRRGDLFQKRQQLMDAWARFATAAPSANVVQIAAAR
jgi:integrase